jgi:hypothetical protein
MDFLSDRGGSWKIFGEAVVERDSCCLLSSGGFCFFGLNPLNAKWKMDVEATKSWNETLFRGADRC